MGTKESPIVVKRRYADATNTQSHQFRQSQENSAQITNIHTYYCGLMDLKMYGWEIVYILRY